MTAGWMLPHCCVSRGISLLPSASSSSRGWFNAASTQAALDTLRWTSRAVSVSSGLRSPVFQQVLEAVYIGKLKKMQMPLPREWYRASHKPAVYLCVETQDKGSGVPSWEWAHTCCFLGNTCILATWWMCTQLYEEDGDRQLSFFGSISSYRNPLSQKYCWINEKKKKKTLLPPPKRYWNVRQKHTFAFQVLSRALWLTTANCWCTKPGFLRLESSVVLGDLCPTNHLLFSLGEVMSSLSASLLPSQNMPCLCTLGPLGQGPAHDIY